MATHRHTVVTSFSPEGYQAYGRDFVTSFRQFFPASVHLHCYLERPVTNYPDEILETGETHAWSLIDEVDGWQQFSDAVKTFPLMCGQTPKGYNIQFDARQCRKAFIEAHSARRFGGKVFWIDADTVVHSPVGEGFLDLALPDDQLCCFLGRDGWFYTESGFIGFNTDHPGCLTFLAAYINFIQNGSIFTQHAWHDCIAFDCVRRIIDEEGFHNLAAGLPQGTMHPFINSMLGSVMDHRKGPRKESRSTSEDLVVARTEPYWQQHAAPDQVQVVEVEHGS